MIENDIDKVSFKYSDQNQKRTVSRISIVNTGVTLCEDSLLLKPLNDKEVIKVPKCTYNNNVKHATTYYFCQCSENLFYPICISCAETCHKHHEPTLKMEGVYDCQCGISNHNIGPEYDERLNQRREASLNICMFSKFFNLPELSSRGFYYVSISTFQKNSLISIASNNNNTLSTYKNPNHLADSKVLCSVCAEFCYKFKPSQLKKIEDAPENMDQYECCCTKHYEFNPVNANLDFIGKFSVLEKNILNFNFNLFLKVAEIKSKYVDAINNVKMFNKKNLKSSDTITEMDKFFTDMYNTKAIELFIFFYLNSHSFFTLKKDFLEGVKTDVLMKLISYVPLSINSKISDYCQIRINFSEIVFVVFIKGFTNKRLNSFNLSTITNMSLLQRYIYFHCSKYFHKLDTASSPFSKFETDTFFDEFAENLFELYDYILKTNENFDFKDKLLNEIFPSLVRMLKYLIKYNLIKPENQKRFFELVLDTLSLKEYKVEIKKNNKEEENEDKKSKKLVKETNNEDDKIEDNKDTYKTPAYNIKRKKETKESTEDNLNFNFNSEDKNNESNNNDELKNNPLISSQGTQPNYTYENTNENKDMYTTEQENNEGEATTKSINNTLSYTEINLVKTCFYYLLHRNDKYVFNRIKKVKSKNNKSFIFVNSEESKIVSKVFLLCLNSFDKSKYSSRNLSSFDEYVKLTLDLMMGGNYFYKVNISNTMLNSEFLLDIFNSSPEDISTDLRFKLVKQSCDNIFEVLVKFVNQNETNNRLYLYNTNNFEKYIQSIDKHVTWLKNTLSSEVDFNSSPINWSEINNTNIDNTRNLRLFMAETNERNKESNMQSIIYSSNYEFQYYLDLDGEVKSSRSTKTKIFIQKLQYCIPYCLFYQKINEIFKYYSEGCAFINMNSTINYKGLGKVNITSNNLENNIASNSSGQNSQSRESGKALVNEKNVNVLSNDTLVFLLKFMYLSCENKKENIALLMDISAKHFVSTYIDFKIIPEFFVFLDNLASILFPIKEDMQLSNKFELNNYTFFFSVLQQLLLRVDFKEMIDVTSYNNTGISVIQSSNFNTKLNNTIHEEDENHNADNQDNLDLKNKNVSGNTVHVLKDRSNNKHVHLLNTNQMNPKLLHFGSNVNQTDYYKSLQIISNILSLIKKSIRSLSFRNAYIIEIVSQLLERLSFIKTNTYLNNEINIALTSITTNRIIKNKEIKVFLLKYFNLLNVLINNNFYFLEVVQEENLIVPLSQIKEIVTILQTRASNFFKRDKQSQQQDLIFKNEDVKSTVEDKVDTKSKKKKNKLPPTPLLSQRNNVLTNSDKTINTNYQEREQIEIEENKELEMEITRLSSFFTYFMKLQRKKTKEKLEAIFTTKLPLVIDNANINFVLHEDTAIHQSKYLKEKSISLSSNIKLFNYYCRTLISEFSVHKEENKHVDFYVYPPHKKTLFIMKHFEYNVLRPYFYLLNLFVLNMKDLKGSTCFYLYKTTHEFLKAVVMLYISLEKIEESFLLVEEEINRDEKCLLNSETLLELEMITIKRKISNTDFAKEIRDLITQFRDSKIKYYDLESIKNCSYKIIFFLLGKNQNKVDLEFDRNKNSFMRSQMGTFMGNVSSFVGSVGNLNFDAAVISNIANIKESQKYYYNKLKEIKEDYEDKVATVYESSLAIISVIQEIDTETDLGLELFNYVFYKLMSNDSGLKEENFKGIFNVNKNQVYFFQQFNSLSKAENSENENVIFKLQNSWLIEIMNYLLYHDSQTFQSLLENETEEDLEDIENDEEKRNETKSSNHNTNNITNATKIKTKGSSNFLTTNSENNNNTNRNAKKITFHKFLTYFSVKIIFPVIINQTINSYQIPFTYRNDFLFILGKQAIKLIQNICEGHNQYFQNQMFNFYFTEEEIKTVNFSYSEFLKEDDLNKEEDLKLNQVKKEHFVSGFTGNLKEKLQKQLKEKGEIVGLFSSVGMQSSGTGGANLASRLSMVRNTVKVEITGKKTFADILKKKKQNRKIEQIIKTELGVLGSKRKSFLNFLCINLKIVLNSTNPSCTDPLNNLNEIIDYSHHNEIYQRLIDLVVEMIQGTKCNNFNNFYKKLPDEIRLIDNNNNLNLEHLEVWEAFTFIKYIVQIKNLLFTKEVKDIFSDVTIEIKQNMFFIINNIINQELPEDNHIIRMFVGLLQPEILLDLLSKYLSGIFIKYILEEDYLSEGFMDYYKDFEFTLEDLDAIKELFIAENDIFEDNFFKLASQIYLFLCTCGIKYEITEADRVIKYSKRELFIHKLQNILVNEESENDSALEGFSIQKVLKDFFNFEFGQKPKYDKKKMKSRNENNNYILTMRFFESVTRSVEFMIDSSNDDGDDLTLKKIYFIVDPKIELISQNNIDNFQNEVDRTSSTSKLKALMEALPYFQSEVNYKYDNIKGENSSSYVKWMLEIDYKRVDLFNFIISIFINLVLLFSLKGSNFKDSNFFTFVLFFVVIQVIMNCIYLLFFFISKYPFYVMVEQRKLEEEDKKELDIRDSLNVYVLNSFIFNEEIYMMFLNIIIGCAGISSSYSSFLFSLQLLTIVKFVPTIKEIVVAFKMRFYQLISMIGFLAILIFFYSNIGFYFLNNDFDTELEDMPVNICQSLLECSVTYFNLGVRSGGGIGDISANGASTKEGLFWFKFATDFVFFVTVILLLLNMINGVIVSTFSQIREESVAKEEDIKNKCFICSIDRLDFEKRKINYEDHCKNEHNINTYIKYLVGIKLINEKDLDADQSYIISCLKTKDIACFPVFRSSSIGDLTEEIKNSEED